MPTTNAEPTDTEAQKVGSKGTAKVKKLVKTAAKKKTLQVELTLDLIRLETRIIVAIDNEASLFAIELTEEKFCPNLDRDLADVKINVKFLVLAVSCQNVCVRSRNTRRYKTKIFFVLS